MKRIKVYSLEDPTNSIPRYIGITKNSLEIRLGGHIKSSKKKITHKDCWVASLNEKGLKPIIKLIDEVDYSEWKFWEKHYISLYKSWGFDLINHTIGGEGALGNKLSKEAKEKISKFQKGKQWSLGVKHSEETINKRLNSEGYKNRNTENGVKKMNEVRRGMTHTEESKTKMSLSQKERFKKYGSSLKGRKFPGRETARLLKLRNDKD